MDKRYRSSIPSEAIERIGLERGELRLHEYLLDDQLIGTRQYDANGTLISETPLRNGKRHGIEYRWDDTGWLVSAEPYIDGLPHGVAKQWSSDGKLIGTYTLKRGTGYDVWRDVNAAGKVYVSEIRYMKDGQPQGFEWWFDEDQHNLFIERHWHAGVLHGIEREWNAQGRIARGWPRYYRHGERVTKRQYIQACKSDSTLPTFYEKDQSPRRNFPPEVQKLLLGSDSSR